MFPKVMSTKVNVIARLKFVLYDLKAEVLVYNNYAYGRSIFYLIIYIHFSGIPLYIYIYIDALVLELKWFKDWNLATWVQTLD